MDSPIFRLQVFEPERLQLAGNHGLQPETNASRQMKRVTQSKARSWLSENDYLVTDQKIAAGQQAYAFILKLDSFRRA